MRKTSSATSSEHALERCASSAYRARDVIGPAVCLGCEQRERVTVLGNDGPEPGSELRRRPRLRRHPSSTSRVPGTQRSQRNARRASSRASEPHGAAPSQQLERVGLVVGLEVRRRVQLEHDVACRNHERVRRVDRLLERRDRPLLARTRRRAVAALRANRARGARCRARPRECARPERTGVDP